MRFTGFIKDIKDSRDSKYADTQGFGIAAPNPTGLGALFAFLAQLIANLFKPPPSPPPSVDLRTATDAHFPPVFDQGQLASCVPNSLCFMLAFVESKEQTGAQGTPLSRLFNYYEDRGGQPNDTGSTARDAIQSVVRVGVSDESLWPYDLAHWKDKPSDAAYANAKPRESLTYAALANVDEMRHCLASGYPFIFGMQLWPQFESVGPDGVVQMPDVSKQPIGWHELCAVGYDADYCIAANPWGQQWGAVGFCRIPWGYFSGGRVVDIWTVRSIPISP